MIDLNLFIALVSFYFVMYVTPGPNNAMVLTSGLKFGFTKTIPHMSGITIGHVLQLILVCLGLILGCFWDGAWMFGECFGLILG